MIFAIIGIIYAAHVGLLAWKLKDTMRDNKIVLQALVEARCAEANASCEVDTLRDTLSALQEQHRQEQENAKQRNSERVRKAWKTRRAA